MHELSPTVSAAASDAGRDLEQGLEGPIGKDLEDLEKTDGVQVPPVTYAALAPRPQSYHEPAHRQSFGAADAKVNVTVLDHP